LIYAQNYEAETKSRGEELAAIAKAKAVISSETVGAEGATYGLNQVSFLQQRLSTRADLANFEAVRFIRKLAQKDHSTALAQLASRMSSAMHAGAGGDVFGKVKGLIADMIEKLEGEAEADATHTKLTATRNWQNQTKRKVIRMLKSPNSLQNASRGEGGIRH